MLRLVLTFLLLANIVGVASGLEIQMKLTESNLGCHPWSSMDRTKEMMDETKKLKEPTEGRKEKVDQLTSAMYQSCNDIDQLMKRVDKLEEIQVKYENRFKAIDAAINNIITLFDKLEKKPKDECYKGMASATIPPRIPVQVLGSYKVLCDTQTDGGGWIIIQRRVSGDIDFYRGWQDYKNGFGSVTTDYWMGNEAIHTLTSQGNFQLRVDMMYKGKPYYATYSSFVVESESSNYRLKLGSYSGNANDSLTYNNNGTFSTKDRDTDSTSSICAVDRHGGWWYYACTWANLNGMWGKNSADGMTWFFIDSSWSSVSSSEMKIRLV